MSARHRFATSVLLVAFTASSGGCVRVQRDTRIEKGPVLRSFERVVALEGGGTVAKVDVAWPQVTLAFNHFELCRQERVEEVVEERITESNAPSAGPAFALGVTGTTVGAGLLAFRGAFSDQPNTRYIDEAGRYGPAPRDVATTWSVILLGVGVPALVTGVIGLLQTGEQTEQRKLEQVASAMELQCKLTPAEGKVELVRAAGEGPESLTVPTQQGRVTLSARQLSEFRLASVHMDGRAVLLPEEEAAELASFLACNDALPVPPPTGLALFTEAELVSRYNAARHCSAVAGAPAASAIEAYEAEIRRRREGGAGPTPAPGPRVQSFEEAVALYPPSLQLTAGSEDLRKLSSIEGVVGQHALLQGTVARTQEDGSLVLDVGGVEVVVLTDKNAPYPVAFQPGARVDVLGTIAAGDATPPGAPAVTARWIRESL